MNFSGPGITYFMLIIPTLFSLAVVGQGAYKMSRGEKDGPVILGFGIVFIILIFAAYFLFIR